jgi:hypothetical protein
MPLATEVHHVLALSPQLLSQRCHPLRLRVLDLSIRKLRPNIIVSILVRTTCALFRPFCLDAITKKKLMGKFWCRTGKQRANRNQKRARRRGGDMQAPGTPHVSLLTYICVRARTHTVRVPACSCSIRRCVISYVRTPICRIGTHTQDVPWYTAYHQEHKHSGATGNSWTWYVRTYTGARSV